jgi:hypothetical protein
VDPNSGLEVDAGFLAMNRNIVDALHVGDTVEKDVALRRRAAVGNRAQALGKREAFIGEIQFQNVVGHGGDGNG